MISAFENITSALEMSTDLLVEDIKISKDLKLSVYTNDHKISRMLEDWDKKFSAFKNENSRTKLNLSIYLYKVSSRQFSSFLKMFNKLDKQLPPEKGANTFSNMRMKPEFRYSPPLRGIRPIDNNPTIIFYVPNLKKILVVGYETLGVFSDIVLDLMQWAFPDLVPLHASAVCINNKVSLVSGEPRAGKTTLAMTFLNKEGASYVSADKTFIDLNGNAVPYHLVTTFGIRTLLSFPSLRILVPLRMLKKYRSMTPEEQWKSRNDFRFNIDLYNELEDKMETNRKIISTVIFPRIYGKKNKIIHLSQQKTLRGLIKYVIYFYERETSWVLPFFHSCSDEHNNEYESLVKQYRERTIKNLKHLYEFYQWPGYNQIIREERGMLH